MSMITQKTVPSLRVWFGNLLTLVEQKLELRWKKRAPPTFRYRHTPTILNRVQPNANVFQPSPT
jgi:hypothetical protein